MNDLEKILEGPRYKISHLLVIRSVYLLKNLQDIIRDHAVRALKGGEEIGRRLLEIPADRQKLGNLQVLVALDAPGPGFSGSPGYVLSQHGPPEFGQTYSFRSQFAEDLRDCRISSDHNPSQYETSR